MNSSTYDPTFAIIMMAGMAIILLYTIALSVMRYREGKNSYLVFFGVSTFLLAAISYWIIDVTIHAGLLRLDVAPNQNITFIPYLLLLASVVLPVGMKLTDFAGKLVTPKFEPPTNQLDAEQSAPVLTVLR